MKKLNLISLLIFSVFIGACDVLNISDEGQIYEVPFNTDEYRFTTDADVYSLKDTVNASFKNKSDQTLFLGYQMCTITELQKHDNKQWKSIPIPIVCAAVVKKPIQVEPGENFKTGIFLPLFDKDNFERGTYRLDIVAKQKTESEYRELTSNNFKIKK